MADAFVVWLLSNEDRRHYRDHRDAFEVSDARFIADYRLNKQTVLWLCEELRPLLQPRRETANTMSVEQRVLCALRFYAAGGFQGTVASDEHIAIHQSTVSRVLGEVTHAIVEHLSTQWLQFPQTDSERAAVKRDFHSVAGLSGVIGCIDGTQVAIKAPSDNDCRFNKAAYWCRKNYYALNAMIVCDANLRILSLDATYPGSVHDSFVWKYSLLREAFLDGHLLGDDEYLLGDSGYPLEPWLFTPVLGTHQRGSPEEQFNRSHRSTRSIVERCIGMLKNRFRCLQRYRALHYEPPKATAIITACAILHNICLSGKISEPDAEPEQDREPSGGNTEDGDDDDSDNDDELAGSLRNRGNVVRRRRIMQLAAGHSHPS